MSLPSGEGNPLADVHNQIMFGPGSAPLLNTDPKFGSPEKVAKQRADEAVAEAK